jgi:hypothetical protein
MPWDFVHARKAITPQMVESVDRCQQFFFIFDGQLNCSQAMVDNGERT